MKIFSYKLANEQSKIKLEKTNQFIYHMKQYKILENKFKKETQELYTGNSTKDC